MLLPDQGGNTASRIRGADIVMDVEVLGFLSEKSMNCAFLSVGLLDHHDISLDEELPQELELEVPLDCDECTRPLAFHE